jgi:tight adherence protein C
MSPEEFIFVKEVLAGLVLFITFPSIKPDMIFLWVCVGFISGYMLPEFWVKGKIKRIKAVIVKELPDAIDLLGLCVNAGLDFMLSLKWVVEKSPPSVMVDELNTLLQEINVGKTRRDAIKDLAARYELADLSTFARTLIQADKMGTSVTEALNILSEDMRLARYRRGETLALKAPMKMLVPLLVFIFPVVGILVAGPILLDFMENNQFQNLAGG